jgi:hypothetical protein
MNTKNDIQREEGPKAKGKNIRKTRKKDLDIRRDKTHYKKEKHKKDARGNGRHP